MLTQTDIKIIKNINYMGTVDLGFIKGLLYGVIDKNYSKYKNKYKALKRVNKLIENGFVTQVKSILGNEYFKITDKGKILLTQEGERINTCVISENSSTLTHHQRLLMVVATLVKNYQCFYRSEYMLRDVLTGSNLPDLIAIIRNKRLIFEIERSQKADDLIGGKLAAYNIEYPDGYVIYLTETNSLANKINKIKLAYGNSERVFAFEIMKFIHQHRECMSDIFNPSITSRDENVH